MQKKETKTNKCILVNIDEINISTTEKPIIGTTALATCVGVLLYSEKHKRAIVAHVADQLENIIIKSIKLIGKNKLDDDIIKYIIIPGYYYNHYEIKNKLEKFYSSIPTFVAFDEKEIPEDGIRTSKHLPMRDFAFDSSIGKFVTDKIFLEEDYLEEFNNHKKSR